MKAILAAALLGGVALSGCVQNYAEREIVQGAAAATLTFPNTPQDAQIQIGQRAYGSASQYPNGIALPQGRHDVIISANGRELHRQAVFVASGARVEVRIP